MKTLNQVQLIGRLVRDPEALEFKNGTKIAKCTVVTDESWKDKATGEWKSIAQFTDIEAGSFIADKILEQGKKGKLVYVSGKLATDTWEGKDGKKQYKVKVKAKDFFLLEKREEGSVQEGGEVSISEIPF